MAIKGNYVYKKALYPEAYVKVSGFCLNTKFELPAGETYKYKIIVSFDIYADSSKDVILLDGSFSFFSNATEITFSDVYLQLKTGFPEMVDC